jgi:hypothetical protein
MNKSKGAGFAAKKTKAGDVVFGPLVEIESRRQDAIAAREAMERELGLQAAAAKLAKPRAAAAPRAGATAAPGQQRTTRSMPRV